MVHQGLILELALEAARVANAIPGLDAYEGCLLAKRTPEGDDGGAECDCHFRIAASA